VAKAPRVEQVERLPALAGVSGKKMGGKLHEYYRVPADLVSHAELYRKWRLGRASVLYKGGDEVRGHVSPHQFEHFPRVK